MCNAKNSNKTFPSEARLFLLFFSLKKNRTFDVHYLELMYRFEGNFDFVSNHVTSRNLEIISLESQKIVLLVIVNYNKVNQKKSFTVEI